MMKAFLQKSFLLCILVFVLSSCEDTIEVDLDNGDPVLVVDAEIIQYYSTPATEQRIYLSRLTDYYAQEPLKVSGAAVKISNSEGENFIFTESSDAGTYTNTDLIPEVGEEYQLEITIENEVYTAASTLLATPFVSRLEQYEDGGFLGEDKQLSIFYDDPVEETNYYLTDFNTEVLQFPDYELTSDDFFNGNEIEDSFSDEDLASGDVVVINFRAISEQFHSYMELILESTNPNPFGTPPASIRGNILNETNPENYAQGYFRVSQVHRIVYEVL